MKILLKALACLCTLFMLTSASCNKEEVLPPETDTGAYTFGCQINGELFIPKGTKKIKSYYQYIYPSGDNGFVFQISGRRDGDKSCEYYQVFINGDSIKIEEGKTYRIADKRRGGFFGNYVTNPAIESCLSSGKHYTTSDSLWGELTIKKFDQTNLIVSGTFWFNLIDTAGNPIKITEGRFDTKYTR